MLVLIAVQLIVETIDGCVIGKHGGELPERFAVGGTGWPQEEQIDEIARSHDEDCKDKGGLPRRCSSSPHVFAAKDVFGEETVLHTELSLGWQPAADV